MGFFSDIEKAPRNTNLDILGQILPNFSGVAESPEVGALTVPAGAVLSRGNVSYIRVNAWRKSRKDDGIAHIKAVKQSFPADDIHAMALELSGAIERLFGIPAAITHVACGHSRTPSCLSYRLARSVSELCGVPHVKAFNDRFLSGSSHPKEFDRLPPLEIIDVPPSPCVVIDDIATSGLHICEAVAALRSAGCSAVGLVWCSGVKAV